MNSRSAKELTFVKLRPRTRLVGLNGYSFHAAMARAIAGPTSDDSITISRRVNKGDIIRVGARKFKVFHVNQVGGEDVADVKAL